MEYKQMPKDLEQARIALLWGGWSDEREISHDSAAACEQALKDGGFSSVSMMDVAAPGFTAKLNNQDFDIAFIAMHGPYGEDGAIQGFCEIAHLPYTFSPLGACALAAHKDIAKKIYREAHIPCAKGIALGPNSPLDEALELSLPLFVKPAANGSSFGVSLVESYEELPQAVELARSSSAIVLVEQALHGTEITVPVIGGAAPRALGPIEIAMESPFYDLQTKYEPAELHHVIPPRLEDSVIKRAQDYALKAHIALGCWGASRSDFIVQDDTPTILETNVIPGMTATSLLPDAARRAGIAFDELCKLFVKWGFERCYKDE